LNSEIKAWLPYLARFLVRRAAAVVPARHRQRYREEWESQVEAASDRPLWSLLVACRILVRAYSVRRARQTVPLWARGSLERQVLVVAAIGIVMIGAGNLIARYLELESDPQVQLSVTADSAIRGHLLDIAIGVLFALLFANWSRTKRYAPFVAAAAAVAWVVDRALRVPDKWPTIAHFETVVSAVAPLLLVIAVLATAQTLNRSRDGSRGQPLSWIIASLATTPVLLGTYVGAAPVILFLLVAPGMALAARAPRHWWACAGIALVLISTPVFAQAEGRATFQGFVDSGVLDYFQAAAYGAVEAGGLVGGEYRPELERLYAIRSEFVVAEIAGRAGVIGVTTFLMLFVALAWASVRLAKDIPRPKRPLVVGLAGLITYPAALQTMVVLGLVSPLSLQLPLGGGGTLSTVAGLASVGLIYGLTVPSQSLSPNAVLPAARIRRHRVRQWRAVAALFVSVCVAICALSLALGPIDSLRVGAVAMFVVLWTQAARLGTTETRQRRRSGTRLRP
jgi:cell division protein FtsW (lipid II flippase)